MAPPFPGAGGDLRGGPGTGVGTASRRDECASTGRDSQRGREPGPLGHTPPARGVPVGSSGHRDRARVAGCHGPHPRSLSGPLRQAVYGVPGARPALSSPIPVGFVSECPTPPVLLSAEGYPGPTHESR